MSRETDARDIWGRLSRLEERTDNHGSAACDMRIKQGQMEVDLHDIERRMDKVEGGFKVALWCAGVAGACIAWVADLFLKGKQ